MGAGGKERTGAATRVGAFLGGGGRWSPDRAAGSAKTRSTLVECQGRERTTRRTAPAAPRVRRSTPG